ncbi:hypothetical protein [Tumebacillus flagellatus]|uniref:Uncharacterized protein n=1 Tax=Tumebacillus flagellatus TaxID=1157490 RepID=A0A074LYX3_9BACL|nr:hypothetical protein [Tumebacillus flagellatus]KEO85248.1 hypothetical protein EL26_01435 [Tumebacillus flagellatus]
MEWESDLKDVEAQVRALPTAALSKEKHQEIYQNLQAAAMTLPRQKRRSRLLKIGLSTASVAAVAVLAVGLYANAHPSSAVASLVQGAGLGPAAPKAAIYTVPAVGSSAHWDVELQASQESDPKSEPNRPRYDVILVYKGQGSKAQNVTVEEEGIGMWRKDGTVIARDTMKVGNLFQDRWPIYQNFTILDQAPYLSFIISWSADGESTQTETVIIPRK